MTEKPKKRGLFRRLLSASHSSLRQAKASMHSSATSPTSPTSKNGPSALSSSSVVPPVPPLPAEIETVNGDDDTKPQSTVDNQKPTLDDQKGQLTPPATPPDQQTDQQEDQTDEKDSSKKQVPQLVTPEDETKPETSGLPCESPDLDKDPEIVTVASPQTDQDHIYDVACQLYDGQASFVTQDQAASWLGDSGLQRGEIRMAYMNLFDWTDKSVLASLRGLCDRIFLKAESQQLDRLIDAFSDRWCECNPQHGFKSPGVIYTLAYSILLLNTDHHSEDYQGAKKMHRSQYVSQTLDTMRNLLKAEDCSVLDNTSSIHDHDLESVTSKRQNSIDSLQHRPSISSKTNGNKKRWSLNGRSEIDNTILVSDGTLYSNREWENMVVKLLKSVYTSIDLTPLNLAGGLDNNDSQSIRSNRLQPHSSYNSFTKSPREPSLLSRFTLNRRSSWMTSNNDTWSDYEYQGVIARETNSKHSLTKRRSMYSETTGGLGIEGVGFMGALRNTMIKEEAGGQGFNVDRSASDLTTFTTDQSVGEGGGGSDNGSMTTAESVKQDDTQNNAANLALHGAPWAKEGLLKFQAYFDTGNVGKKYKKKDWVQVFVVVQKGYLKMFRFNQGGSSTNSHNLAQRRSRARLSHQPSSIYSTNGLHPSTSAGYNASSSSVQDVQVGGGNWLDNATMTDNISLCHCMAQVNPLEAEKTKIVASKRSSIIMSSDQHHSHDTDSTQWSLTLPNNGTLLFLAGTREIADEYVYACNYWASRVSKEPLIEAVSNMEYGWSRPIELLNDAEPQISSGSFDTLVVNSERIQVKEWKPPLLSTVQNHLEESEQLEALKTYISTVEKSLEEHSQARADMIKIFKPSYLVSTRAHFNWEKRSGYLLKETIKYEVYVSTLERAIKERQEFAA